MDELLFDGVCVVCGKSLIRWRYTRKEGIHGACMDNAIKIILKYQSSASTVRNQDE